MNLNLLLFYLISISIDLFHIAFPFCFIFLNHIAIQTFYNMLIHHSISCFQLYSSLLGYYSTFSIIIIIIILN